MAFDNSSAASHRSTFELADVAHVSEKPFDINSFSNDHRSQNNDRQWKPSTFEEGQNAQLGTIDRNNASALPMVVLGMVDYTGLQQRDSSTGIAFGIGGKTYHDEISQSIQDKMTPNEKQKFAEEQKKLDEYHAAVNSIDLSQCLGCTSSRPIPPYPDTPMHKEVDKRIQESERSIIDHVNAGLSTTDKQRLSDEFGAIEKAQHEQSDCVGKSPMGTGCARPIPAPGPMMQEYYSRVAQATHQYLKGSLH